MFHEKIDFFVKKISLQNLSIFGRFDCMDLWGDDAQNLDVNPVELVKAAPRPGLRKSAEELSHHLWSKEAKLQSGNKESLQATLRSISERPETAAHTQYSEVLLALKSMPSEQLNTTHCLPMIWKNIILYKFSLPAARKPPRGIAFHVILKNFTLFLALSPAHKYL